MGRLLLVPFLLCALLASASIQDQHRAVIQKKRASGGGGGEELWLEAGAASFNDSVNSGTNWIQLVYNTSSLTVSNIDIYIYNLSGGSVTVKIESTDGATLYGESEIVTPSALGNWERFHFTAPVVVPGDFRFRPVVTSGGFLWFWGGNTQGAGYGVTIPAQGGYLDWAGGYLRIYRIP